MRCSEASKQIQLYLDNQLSLRQVRELEAHIAVCASCQQELSSLEEMVESLNGFGMVAEPAYLTIAIMQRVAMSTQQYDTRTFKLWRPSLRELIAAVILATITTMGIILGQPALRAVLPIANGHDPVSLFFLNILQILTTTGGDTISLILWIGGTILGICITLALAGSEVRTQWYKTMMEHLPVR
ncbi:MAG TPA: zf-HC2 domain-containing protein [Ktedonobacteraceae bacterium]|nr:zf-HC2 domain-containing protein [Ktedonobacteraceae bacterium]